LVQRVLPDCHRNALARDHRLDHPPTVRPAAGAHGKRYPKSTKLKNALGHTELEPLNRVQKKLNKHRQVHPAWVYGIENANRAEPTTFAKAIRCEFQASRLSRIVPIKRAIMCNPIAGWQTDLTVFLPRLDG
jgi:3'-phosphoadenosine 5'-phosphosulfate sulfotransferase (PAPS reductase)/FAD synthetase